MDYRFVGTYRERPADDPGTALVEHNGRVYAFRDVPYGRECTMSGRRLLYRDGAGRRARPITLRKEAVDAAELEASRRSSQCRARRAD